MPNLPVLDEMGKQIAETLCTYSKLAAIQSPERRVLVVILAAGYYEDAMDNPDGLYPTSLDTFSKYLEQECGVSIAAEEILPMHEWCASTPNPGEKDPAAIANQLIDANTYCVNTWHKYYMDDFIDKCEEIKKAGGA